MPYLFTSESVSEGHPDKISDQISDALVDHFLAYDKNSKIACETLVTTGQVILAGEVRSRSYLDVQSIARHVIKEIGYTNSRDMFEANSCGILSSIHEQSTDIYRGVDKKSKEDQGAGDQGIMFGYATNETDNYMPLPIELAHMLVWELARIRKEGKIMKYLKPDAKSQVTVEYDNNDKPIRIDTIVISTQHDDFDDVKTMLKTIKGDILSIVIPQVKKRLPRRIQRLFSATVRYKINPTGKFVIGGPHGDTGMTGRKIIVDTYGGQGAHGGGAFSGKDPSKVDRSASYATRHIAKNMVAAKLCDKVLIQIAYAIGVAKPIGLYVNTYNTSHVAMDDGLIAKKIEKIFDMRPYYIEKRFNLRSPIYRETAAYGHMGRKPRVVEKIFNENKKNQKKVKVELFPWEKLDHQDKLIKMFS